MTSTTRDDYGGHGKRHPILQHCRYHNRRRLAEVASCRQKSWAATSRWAAVDPESRNGLMALAFVDAYLLEQRPNRLFVRYFYHTVSGWKLLPFPPADVR